MDLLTDLYLISSHSGEEKNMITFVLNKLDEMHLDYTTDASGNIFVTKGKSDIYPCVVAHLDEVHKYNKNKQIITTEDLIIGFDDVECKPCGIGADDKNGIWVALKMLKKHNILKAAFFVGEEVGCKGSNSCNMDFFKDCGYVIQCDRKFGTNFINNACSIPLCSKEFEDATDMKDYGYSTTPGLTTDVYTLRKRGLAVSACNLSCGYYNPHTANETTKISELENCLEFVDHIITKLGTTKYPCKKYEAPTYYSPSLFGGKLENSHHTTMLHYIIHSKRRNFTEYYRQYVNNFVGIARERIEGAYDALEFICEWLSKNEEEPQKEKVEEKKD